jgi:translation elongation factor P/translation initiation factor 5A
MKRITNFTNLRYFSKERAGKSIRPGATIVLNGVPHRVTKMIQGKRGKGY